jgi:type IV pilus assembly protein PilM
MALGFRQSGQWVLDIGGSNLVLLHLSGDPGSLKLRQLFDWPLPEGLVVDGEIVDGDLFGRELKALVSQHKLRGRSVQVGVSNQKVIVRNIDMPEMTEEELRGAIEFQAQDYIPIPVDEAVLDFQVVGKRVNPDGGTRQEVLLVAAQRMMIETLLGAVRQAGLKLAGIDVSSLALTRALLPPASFLGDNPEGGICRGIADISSSVSTLVVALDGIMKFTRIINFSSDQFPRALTEQRGIPYADAQTMVQRLGLSGPLPADAEYYPEDVVSDTHTQLGQGAFRLPWATPLCTSLRTLRTSPMPPWPSWHPRWQSRSGLRSLETNDMARRVNLVPPSERSRSTTDFSLLILVGVTIVVIFAIGFGWYLLNGNLTDREQELADLQQQNAELQTQLAELRQYGDIQRARVDAEAVVQDIYASRTLVSDVLDAISLVVPDNTWFQSIALSTLDPTSSAGEATGSSSSAGAGDNQMSIEGNTYSFEDIAQVLVRLQLVPSLSDVSLVSAGLPRGSTDPEIEVKGFSVEAVIDAPESTDTPLPLSQVEVE